MEAIETVKPTALFADFPKLDAWRRALAERPSIRDAAPGDFVPLYLDMLRKNWALVTSK